MRLSLPSVKHASDAASRLQRVFSNGSRKMTLVVARRGIARCLGFADWDEMATLIVRSNGFACSPDHLMTEDIVIARRRIQAVRLARAIGETSDPAGSRDWSWGEWIDIIDQVKPSEFGARGESMEERIFPDQWEFSWLRKPGDEMLLDIGPYPADVDLHTLIGRRHWVNAVVTDAGSHSDPLHNGPPKFRCVSRGISVRLSSRPKSRGTLVDVGWADFDLTLTVRAGFIDRLEVQMKGAGVLPGCHEEYAQAEICEQIFQYLVQPSLDPMFDAPLTCNPFGLEVIVSCNKVARKVELVRNLANRLSLVLLDETCDDFWSGGSEGPLYIRNVFCIEQDDEESDESGLDISPSDPSLEPHIQGARAN